MKLKLLSFLLAAAAAGTAHAAFYVDDDSPRQTPLQIAAAHPPVAYRIPFFLKHGRLGPKGRQTLLALLADARTADTVIVVGHDDPTNNATLRRQRAIAIKQWLIQNDIPDSKIELREDATSLPSGAASVFNSEVILTQPSQSDTATLDPALLRSATLVHEPLTPRRATQPTSANIQQPLSDPAKLAIAAKIIALSQNKLIRPEDVVTLLAELLRNMPAETPSPQPTHGLAQPLPPVQIQSTPRPDLPPASPLARQFAPAAEQPRTWLLDSHKTLRTNLEDWAKQAGWKKPAWQPNNPYQITFSSTMRGSLLDVLGEIAKAVPELDIQVSRAKREIRVSEGQK